MAIKSIGKAVKSPLFKTISNTIKKPIIKSIRSTIKNSMRVFDYNKNTIKNLASGLEGKYLRTRHNFGSRPIKYLGEEGIKKFKYIAPQAVRGGKQIIRPGEWIKGKQLSLLINMVSKSKPFVPLLFAVGSLNRLTQMNFSAEQMSFFSNNQETDNKGAKSGSDTLNNGLIDSMGPLGDGKWDKDVIKLSNFNVNGVRAIQKRGDLNNYINTYKPDALILNETKIDEQAFNKDKPGDDIPKEYNQYWSFCKVKKGYSGVCLFSKTKPISVQEGMGVEKHDEEGRTITAEYENFYLVGVYVPNSGTSLIRLDYRCKEWNVDFQNYLNKLKKKKHVVLCGDQNVVHHGYDVFNFKKKPALPGMTPEEKQGMDSLLHSGWIDTFRELYPDKKQFSWWSYRTRARAYNAGWRIDYFLVNDNAMSAVKDSKIIDQQMGSDHCPIELDLDIKKLSEVSI